MVDQVTIFYILLLCALHLVVSEMKFNVTDSAKYFRTEDSTKIFDCTYTSDKPIKRIDWFRDDIVVSSYKRYPPERFYEKRQIMKISRFKAKDSGVYKCVLYEDVDVDSKDVTIERSFYVPPTRKPYIIKYKQQFIQANVNDQVKFKCLVSRYYSKSYKWLKNGQIIKSESRVKIKPYKFLRIRKVSMADTGAYTCSVENEIGRNEVVYMLKVDTKNKTTSLRPRLYEEDVYSIVDIVLNDVTVDCSLTGAKPINVTWYKNNKTLDMMPRTGHYDYEFEADGQKLILNGILPTDAGEYTCFAQNRYGSVRHTFTVDPQERRIAEPQFLNKNGVKVFQAYDGSDLTVEIHVISWGTAHFQLLYHKNISNSSNTNETTQIVVMQTPRKYDIIPNDKSTHAETRKMQFFFRNITDKDYGTYSVMAGSNVGFDVYQFVIEEIPKPTPSVATNRKSPKEKTNIIFIALASLVGFLLLILPIILFVWCRRSRKLLNNNDKSLLTAGIPVTLNLSDGEGKFTRISDSTNSPRKIHFSSSRLSSCQTEKEYFYQALPQDPEWEVPLENIEFKGICGEGAFGKVMYATVHALKSHTAPLTCAVKTLKDNATQQELKDLLSEIQVMKNVGSHKNIINLLGVCSQQGEIYMIVEFCRFGNLRTYLKQRRPTKAPLPPPIEVLTLRHLTSFCLQVAEGMDYLAEQKCIHRDIAARNILVAEDHVVKIADFGLARDIHVTDYYRKCTDGRLPVKWMAMEALFDRVYTTQSDIWSFGILVWEIVTFGGSPYPGIPLECLFDLLKQGYRMEQPVNCTNDMYALMLNCWKEIPTKRPTFFDLINDLQKMLDTMQSTAEYMNLQPPIINPFQTESVSSPIEDNDDDDDDDTNKHDDNSLKDISRHSSSSVFEKDTKLDDLSSVSDCGHELTVELPSENDILLKEDSDTDDYLHTKL